MIWSRHGVSQLSDRRRHQCTRSSAPVRTTENSTTDVEGRIDYVSRHDQDLDPQAPPVDERAIQESGDARCAGFAGKSVGGDRAIRECQDGRSAQAYAPHDAQTEEGVDRYDEEIDACRQQALTAATEPAPRR